MKKLIKNFLSTGLALIALSSALHAQVKTYIRILPDGRRYTVVRSLPQPEKEATPTRPDPTSAENRSFYPTDHPWVPQANPTAWPTYRYRDVTETKSYPVPGYNWSGNRTPYQENYNAIYRRQPGKPELPYPDEVRPRRAGGRYP